jgi:hypothetical protein
MFHSPLAPKSCIAANGAANCCSMRNIPT